MPSIECQSVDVQAQFSGDAEYPTGTSPWGMRFEVAFLFPKLTKPEEKMLLEKKLKQLDAPEPEKKK